MERINSNVNRKGLTLNYGIIMATTLFGTPVSTQKRARQRTLEMSQTEKRKFELRYEGHRWRVFRQWLGAPEDDKAGH